MPKQGQQEAQRTLAPAHRKQLEHLQSQFTTFRSLHRSRHRIPKPLRYAVLDAVAAGLPENRACAVCGISSKQLEVWRSADDRPASDGVVGAAAPRVISVVDDLVPRSVERTEGGQVASVLPGATELGLEVRLGAWRVRLSVDPDALPGLATVEHSS